MSELLTPAGRKEVKLMRKAIKWHEEGEPVKDLGFYDDQMIAAIALLLELLDENLPGWADAPKRATKKPGAE